MTLLRTSAAECGNIGFFTLYKIASSCVLAKALDLANWPLQCSKTKCRNLVPFTPTKNKPISILEMDLLLELILTD